MDSRDAVATLQAHADAIRATSLYLYGSVARDHARSGSDLDVFIEYDPNSRFNAFDLVGIKHFLEDRLGAPLDLTTRDSLHPRLAERIEGSAIRVF